MKSDASISVILRTFDRNEQLAEALESLAKQTCRNFEVVIVDMNKSGVSPVLKSFHQRLPQVRHLPIGKLLPTPEAMNQGICNAAADKIAILDDDNLYDPTHLEVLVEGLERTRADLVYTGVRRTTYTQTGQLSDVAIWHRPYNFTQLLFGNYIHTAGTAFWKRTWERLGGFDPRFPVYEDYEFLLRVGMTGQIECLPAVTAESRSFTGKPGIQNHTLYATRHMRRCEAGIYWLHRDLFFSPERRRAASSTRLKAKEVTGHNARGRRLIQKLLSRGQLGVDLLGWWWHHALPNRKRG
jgi:glycosyltransferase involved in cell wall biosynthesis